MDVESTVKPVLVRHSTVDGQVSRDDQGSCEKKATIYEKKFTVHEKLSTAFSLSAQGILTVHSSLIAMPNRTRALCSME